MSTETPGKAGISASVPQQRAGSDGHPTPRTAPTPPPVPGADYRRTTYWRV